MYKSVSLDKRLLVIESRNLSSLQVCDVRLTASNIFAIVCVTLTNLANFSCRNDYCESSDDTSAIGR